MKIIYLFLFSFFILLSCKAKKDSQVGNEDADIVTSIITESDSTVSYDFLQAPLAAISRSLQNKVPVMPCGDSLNALQLTAQSIALQDSLFTISVRNKSGEPYRNEIFNVYPARQSDVEHIPNAIPADCFKVEMYNYTLNLSTAAIADIKQKKVLAVTTAEQTQPEIPAYLKKIAILIAINSKEMQDAYGLKPGDKDALMASTKTALNHTHCERSRHLCVAPTFIKNDKALWAIVDLTDFKLAGIRWTNTGTTGAVTPITERKLQDDKITACFCERETSLEKFGWKMKYMLTSSDGLRIAGVSFQNSPVLQSAKLVDWHVSYSGTDGFGYSDAVGCPYFSQAAVIAYETPKILEIKDDGGAVSGFALEQIFRSELWPKPCNYNYRQRYEFYKDGRFRVAAASLGRGCGNDGTYRPVFRIAFAGEQNNFSEWNGTNWLAWQNEKWQQQTEVTKYSAEGFEYLINGANGNSYGVSPGRGLFNDGGRADNAFVYVTQNKPDTDEGESDLLTIGPCCNTDFHQGPEKFIGGSPDNIQNKKLVFWYVAQLKNDDTKGKEYCWAESIFENGKYVTKAYPCFAGPMFTPIKSLRR